MLEAFERHLSDIEISKRFEKAKTKEEKIAACKKYLEDNEYSVTKKSSNYNHQDDADEAYTFGMGGGFASKGTLTIDANTFNNAVISSGNKNVLGNNIVNNTPRVEYLTARSRVTQEEIDLARDPFQIENEVGRDLRNLLKKELDYLLQNNPKCMIKDKNYVTGEVLYGIKIGVVL